VPTAERYVSTLLGGMLDELDDAARAEAETALRGTLQEHLGPDGVTYPSAMWIITCGRSGS
jgi:hypothetical protein